MDTLNQGQKAVYIGIVTYGALTAPYVSLFKQSLEKQSFRDFELLVHDNTDENLGFAKAYNLLIRQAKAAGARYFFAINPDVYLEPLALEKLVVALESDPSLASVAPKLRRWNFKEQIFTNSIDSCGLGLKRGLIFFDIGQSEDDRGQYDHSEIIGPSGAAALYRISALDRVLENGNYFDEHFFMYKEDCDLAYRLKLAGSSAKLIPEAIGFHDRSVSGGNFWHRLTERRKRSRTVNQWNFTNQHILYIKYWHRLGLFDKLFSLVRMTLLFIEALIFEQSLLACYTLIRSQAATLKRY